MRGLKKMIVDTMPFKTTPKFPIPPVPKLSPQWPEITGIAVELIERTEGLYLVVHYAAETPASLPSPQKGMQYFGQALNRKQLKDVLVDCESGMKAANMVLSLSTNPYKCDDRIGKIYFFPEQQAAFGRLEEVVCSLEGRLGFVKG